LLTPPTDSDEAYEEPEENIPKKSKAKAEVAPKKKRDNKNKPEGNRKGTPASFLDVDGLFNDDDEEEKDEELGVSTGNSLKSVALTRLQEIEPDFLNGGEADDNMENEVSQHKKEIEYLKKHDPEFVKFLQEEGDTELLEFGNEEVVNFSDCNQSGT
jgi:hypothetical protein